MKNTSLTEDVDKVIYSCLDLKSPKSFFVFAGAGSGKTRSLVTVLKKFRDDNSHMLQKRGQKVAVITYTNAACDEIRGRLEYDSNFVVSTIHAFCWELIRPFQENIKEWVRQNCQDEIWDLEEKQRKGRGGKAASDREKQIAAKQKRLASLDSVKSFSYNPSGTNSGRDSLNHAEVIKIAAEFISSHEVMKKILVTKYPVLLIDECQDTKRDLIEAIMDVQTTHSNQFTLGLFGDMMQRIYLDGKTDLGHHLPAEWLTPEKITNYRCPTRIIALINRIRANVDKHLQVPSEENVEGTVRLFIVDSNGPVNKRLVEEEVAKRMEEITSDPQWSSFEPDVKTLTLEHHMAARRGGFYDFFTPLYNGAKDSTGLLDGKLKGIPFFTEQILPLVIAKRAGDEFAVAEIMKRYSPLLSRQILKMSKEPVLQLRKANSAVDELMLLWENGREPSLGEVLRKTAELEMFVIPETLVPIAYRDALEPDEEQIEDSVTGQTVDEEPIDKDAVIDAWDLALATPFNQLEAYAEYISDRSAFGTHQGVKGLEFPRVMVILDDEEAKGFLFSYEKLFQVKELSDTDRRNMIEGVETSIERTRRLFYVTCSRARNSLAIVAYSKNPDLVKEFGVEQGWFSEEEIVRIH